MSQNVQMCIPCVPHEFQDSTYGKNRRVHTTAQPKLDHPRKIHCTVCGKETRVESRKK